MAQLHAGQQPGTAVNDAYWLGDVVTVLVNGRWLPSAEPTELDDRSCAGVVDGDGRPRRSRVLAYESENRAWSCVEKGAAMPYGIVSPCRAANGNGDVPASYQTSPVS